MSKLLPRIFCALVFLAALPAVAQFPDESAKTNHFFPLVADGGGFQSVVFLTNAADAGNQCRIDLQGPGLDGALFIDNRNGMPVFSGSTVELAAGESLVVSSNGFQPLAFGYATLECTEPAVARVVLSLSEFGPPIALTTLESAQLAREFQFPVLPRLGAPGLVFSNGAGLDATCAIELEDTAGAGIGGASVVVPARSTAVEFLGEAIPLPGGFEGGTARAVCTGDVAALELTLSDPIFAALSPVVTSGDATAKPRHSLPLIVEGEGFRSSVLVTNLAAGANRCTLDLFGSGLDTGRFAAADRVRFSGSSATLDFSGPGERLTLAGSGEGPLAFGYATVDCDEAVVARTVLTAGTQDSIAGAAVIPTAQPATSVRFPVAPLTDRLALILTNDSDAGAACAAVLADFQGRSLTGDSVSVPGKTTTVRFLGDLFEFLDFFPGGTATVSCTGNVTATTLPLFGAVFTALPPAVISLTEHDSDVPFFPIGSNPGDQTFLVDELTFGLELPRAIGGNGSLTYSLQGSVPGMSFDPALRLFSGTPTTVGEYAMTYTATDEDGDSDSLAFTVSVEPDSAPSLAAVAPLQDLRFTLDEAIEPVTLPEAEGGNGPLFYVLTEGESEFSIFSSFFPSFVPGLQFDPVSRRLSGTPTETGVYDMVYTALDADLDEDSLAFTITVTVPVTSESLVKAEGCANGDFVEDADGNSGLIADCRALVDFANALIETGLITEENVLRQWGKGEQTRLDAWDGIRVVGGRVVSVSLDRKELKGDFPPQLGRLDALEDLSLSGNDLTGPIPPELAALSSLETMWLFSNRLGGAIPPELARMPSLEILSLGSNRLSGPIPPELGQMDRLEDLSLWGNELSGSIPPELAQLRRLEELSLGLNELSGSIPPELGQLPRLERLSLGFNELTGPIPAELAQLGRLTSLELNRNGLDGSIPPELGQLDRLTELDLGHNELAGTIPPEFGQLIDLEELNLQNNRFTGPIPPELSRLDKLQDLILENNQLSGAIPLALGDLLDLRELLLSENRLTGTVPEELAQLEGLEILDVEFNELSGTLPWAFRARVERGDIELRILGNLIVGFGAPPPQSGNPGYSAVAADNGNASHHSISWYQGPLLLEWDWKGDRREHQTPILGRRAALAVNVDHEAAAPPPVITRVLDAQDEVLIERLEQVSVPDTEEIETGRWRTKYVFDLPGEYYREGNSVVHVIDPDDELAETDETDNVAEPIVLHGEVPPKFRATFLPLQFPDQEEWHAELDPEVLMVGTRAYLPIADDYEARIGPVLESDSRNPAEIIVKLLEKWNLEADPDEFYHAVANENIGGIGLLGSRVAVSTFSIHFVIPHEFGHNFELRHPPGCFAAGPDENYPYPEGRLGPIPGWQPNWRLFVSGENEVYADVMSYCGDFHHITDYHYRLAAEYWLSIKAAANSGAATLPAGQTGEESSSGSAQFLTQAASSAGDTGSVALSGRITAAGVWSLSQAQLSERAPRSPPEDGEYTLILFDSAGIQLYSEPLTAMALSEGDDSFWAARTPPPLRAVREIVILDAAGDEALRQPLPELE